MTVTKTYNSIASWTRPEIHTKDIDIGSHGDAFHGYITITGDRWKHERVGFVKANTVKVTQSATNVAYEYLSDDSNAGQDKIYILNTTNFLAGDDVYIENNVGTSETATIFSVQDNVTLTLSGNLTYSYETSKNSTVSRLVKIYIEKGSTIAAGDWIEKDGNIYQVQSYEAAGGSHPDEDMIRLKNLNVELNTDEILAILNTSGWVRDLKNPIINPQRKNFFDYSGQNIKSPEMFQAFDIQKDSKDNTLATKHGMFVTTDIEDGASQISLMLSKDDEDIYNYSTFLGNNNSGRPNPIIRASNNTEAFSSVCYNDDIDEIKKVWNTTDGTITLAFDSTPSLKVTYTDDGEVYALFPVPINGEILTNGSNTLSFSFKGTAGNTGSLYVDLLDADGTKTRYVPAGGVDIDVLTFTTYTFDFSANSGRKYIRAIIFGITGNGSGIIYLKTVTPFMTPRWDEIIEDPSVVKDTAGVGNFVCYYTARERPRTMITADVASQYEASIQIQVADTSIFDAGDKVVIYDADDYEMAVVDSIDSSTLMTIKHIGSASGDITSYFEKNYQSNANNLGLIANNTYRVNQIAVAYLIPSIVKSLTGKYDNSQWVKYPSNEAPSRILSPSTTPGDWDSLSVSSPSVKAVGGRIEMAYVGCCDRGDEQIGMASSGNYVTFTKNVKNPLIVQSANFDSDGCLDPDLNIFNNKAIMHYTGLSSGVKTIGSAFYQTRYNGNLSKMHVAMLVFPLSSEGNVPDNEVRTLFDMGNFRIDVHPPHNTLSAHAYVHGKWIDTKTDDNVDISNAWGTALIHDHWNLIVGQYNCGQVSIHKTNMMVQDSRGLDIFNNSPWVLSCDAAPGATQVTLKKFVTTDGTECTFIPRVENVAQDIGFYGWGFDGADKTGTTNIQMNRITSVTDNGDSPRTYTCDLLYPIGTWGFSSDSVSFKDESGNYLKAGVLLGQGITDASWSTFTQDQINTYKKYGLIHLGVPSDQARVGIDNTGKMSNASNIWTKMLDGGTLGGMATEGYWRDYKTGKTLEAYKMKNANGYQDGVQYTWIPPTFDPRPILDPSLSKPPVIGNNQEFNQAWNLGYIGHVDIATNEIWEDPANGVFCFTNIYNQAINSSNPAYGSTAKPQWHLFDLSAVGGEISPNNLLTRWILTDWDETKFPGTDADDALTGLDLYLSGSALQCDAGYLGSTMKMTNKLSDAAITEFFTGAFTPINTTPQLDIGTATDWDDTNVSKPNLFKYQDNWYLGYTGQGKKLNKDSDCPFPESGYVVGDIYETSTEPDVAQTISYAGRFEIPTGCKITLYMSWNKKSNWILIDQWDSSGYVSVSDSCVMPEDVQPDYRWNIRWKLLLESNPLTYDLTPIVKEFSVTYDDTYEGMSDEFYQAQRNAIRRKPVNKVMLYISTGDNAGTFIDLSDLHPIIDDLSYQIPMQPDNFSEIYTSDVSLTFQNIDNNGTRTYFSENNANSPFYGRIYAKDEIFIYSGFITPSHPDGEFCVTGRFYINHIELTIDGAAVIYCRSILRAAINTVIGKKVDGEDSPLSQFDGQTDVTAKQLLENLLTSSLDGDGNYIGAGIEPENVFIEDFDREFNNIQINNMSVGSACKKIAQACGGFIYTNNQGDVFFKTPANFESMDATNAVFSISVNTKNYSYIGQDFDKMVRSVNVVGDPNELVQGESENTALKSLYLGNDVPIENDWIQKNEYAESIADMIIANFDTNNSTVTLDSIFLPSIKILDTIELTMAKANITSKKYLVVEINKNLSTFQESYKLVSNFAKTS